MAKGYWVGHVEVSDMAAFKRYIDAAGPVFQRYGARFLARGGRAEELEGEIGRSRHVVYEFPSYEDAVACYRSADYQSARAHRDGAAEVSITIVEGLDA